MNKIVLGNKPALPNTACYSVLLSVYLVKNLVDNLPAPSATLKLANPESLNDAPCFVLNHSNLKHFVANINSEPRFGNAFRDVSQNMKELNLTGMVKPDLKDADTAFLITDVELVDSGLAVGQYRVFYTTGNVTVNHAGLLNKYLCSDGVRENVYFTMAVRHYGPDTAADIKELIGITTTPKYTNGRGWVVEQLLRYIEATNTIDFNPVMMGVADAPAEQDLNAGDDCKQESPSDVLDRVVENLNEYRDAGHVLSVTRDPIRNVIEIELLPDTTEADAVNIVDGLNKLQDVARAFGVGEGIWQFSTVPFGQAGKECVMDDEKSPMPKSTGNADDKAFEQKLIDKGLLAPRITVDEIEKLMAQVIYTCHVVKDTNTTIAVAILPIGEKMFTLDFGWSSPASNANFNAELGKEAAIKDATAKARNKLWELEGYRLAHSLCFP